MRSYLALIHRNKFNRTMSGKDDQARERENNEDIQKTRNEKMIIQVTTHRTVTRGPDISVSVRVQDQSYFL